MDSRVLRNFEMYFPVVASKMVSYRKCAVGLTIELDDGDRCLYDDMEHSIRWLPRDSMSLTEVEFKNEFRRRLYKLMLMKHITQEELSEKTGVTTAMISRYMTGKAVPGFYIIDKLAKALDCSVDDFRYLD